jgi:hypothetical protein
LGRNKISRHWGRHFPTRICIRTRLRKIKHVLRLVSLNASFKKLSNDQRQQDLAWRAECENWNKVIIAFSDLLFRFFGISGFLYAFGICTKQPDQECCTYGILSFFFPCTLPLVHYLIAAGRLCVNCGSKLGCRL